MVVVGVCKVKKQKCSRQHSESSFSTYFFLCISGLQTHLVNSATYCTELCAHAKQLCLV